MLNCNVTDVLKSETDAMSLERVDGLVQISSAELDEIVGGAGTVLFRISLVALNPQPLPPGE